MNGNNIDGSGPSAVPKLALNGVELGYQSGRGRIVAVRDVDLSVAEGEFVTVVGPSGCGKSTLLKLIAGLLPLSKGSVTINGRPPEEEPHSARLLFQNDALLPWCSVADNIRFPLAVERVPTKRQEERVDGLIELMALDGFASFFPQQLSGGMRKRVALARILAADPEVFLMDEPFGPLDAITRSRITADFLALWENLGKTVVFITHDVDEAILMSDRVVVMTGRPGRIRDSFEVTLPRPRSLERERFSPEFRDLHERISRSLIAGFGAHD